MFDSLKKKLKDVIGKISGKISSEKEEMKTEEKPEIREVAEEIKESVEERIEREIEKEIEEIKEIEKREEISPEVAEEFDKEKEKLEEIEKEEKIEEKKEIWEKEAKEFLEEEKEKIERLEPERKEELEKTIEEVEEKRKERIVKLPTEVSHYKHEEEIIKPSAKVSHDKEEKPRFFSLVKKIKEKTLSEDDVNEVLEGLQTALLENDVALEVADRICSDVKQELVGKSVKRGEVENVIEESLKTAMTNVLQQDKINIEDMIDKKEGPLVIMFLGFNGTGKTTTLAKFANKFKKYKPILAAGDTFRAASIEQLEEHGRNLKMDVVKHRYGADSAAVIFDAKKHAEASNSKLVFADTAGRTHTNANLMDELKKVCRVNKPDLKILVLDALTGNDIYEQARLFDNAVGVDAIILTKVDVYEKGGAALSAAYTIKKPILFLGVGQGYDDLKEFKAEDIVKNLLG